MSFSMGCGAAIKAEGSSRERCCIMERQAMAERARWRRLPLFYYVCILLDAEEGRKNSRMNETHATTQATE